MLLLFLTGINFASLIFSRYQPSEVKTIIVKNAIVIEKRTIFYVLSISTSNILLIIRLKEYIYQTFSVLHFVLFRVDVNAYIFYVLNFQ